MKGKLAKKELIEIAIEIYKDGKSYSESYSSNEWERNGWPVVDDDVIYKMLDSYVRFLRYFDDYKGRKRPERKQNKLRFNSE